MISVLTLALMVLLVATRRPAGSFRSKKPARGKATGGDKLILGPGVRLGPAVEDPERPGVVSYALLNDKKLPSPAQRALRRMLRPFNWVYRRFVPLQPDDPTTEGRGARPSAELQNFLDARNREIARRKAEGQNKPGPDDRLH